MKQPRGIMLAAVVTALCVGAVGEPTAWQGTSWGMKIDEIRTAFPAGEVVDMPAPAPLHIQGVGTTQVEVGHICIPSIDVIGEKFKVVFLTDPGGLHQINLDLLNRDHASKALFHRLEAALAVKYGRPLARTTETASTSLWKTKTSVVELNYFHAPLIDSADFFITYRPIPNDPL